MFMDKSLLQTVIKKFKLCVCSDGEAAEGGAAVSRGAVGDPGEEVQQGQEAH